MNFLKKLFGRKKYVCSQCGKEHDEWPALTFNSPDNYHNLSKEDKETIAEIDTDLCIIKYPDQTDRFIRVTLTQLVNDNCEDLNYGVWVSLSEKSYNDYSTNFGSNEGDITYFGYLCNAIPEYEDTTSIHTTVYTRSDGYRPYVVPHESFDHPFVKDYYNGISKAEAEKRIKAMMSK